MSQAPSNTSYDIIHKKPFSKNILPMSIYFSTHHHLTEWRHFCKNHHCSNIPLRALCLFIFNVLTDTFSMESEW